MIGSRKSGEITNQKEGDIHEKYSSRKNGDFPFAPGIAIEGHNTDFCSIAKIR
jgi:hypothetical protein